MPRPGRGRDARGCENRVPPCEFIILLADRRFPNRDHQPALGADWIEGGIAEVTAGKLRRFGVWTSTGWGLVEGIKPVLQVAKLRFSVQLTRIEHQTCLSLGGLLFQWAENGVDGGIKWNMGEEAEPDWVP